MPAKRSASVPGRRPFSENFDAKNDGPGRLRKVRCEVCRAIHVRRDRRPGWCLDCDIVDRHREGFGADGISGYVGLPVFLIEKVLSDLADGE